ncbi:MAG: hypothetical protein M9945_15000 [Aquamicrobium sp.]|uniref:hypothetical protein n=1 Tax=Aquamicrobium sp. TaxID=1872579 RepID=UPI00349E652B|nr:hypothetical protein [Aquamicrobium sp.]
MKANRIGLVLPVLAGMLAGTLAGCAKNPDAIAPISMPVNAYAGLSCDQLVVEHRRSAAALAAVSQQQKQAATGDAVGVFFIGVPVSSLSGGDKEGLVALHKGEIVAIEGAMRTQHCAAPAPEAAAPARTPASASAPPVTPPPPH